MGMVPVEPVKTPCETQTPVIPNISEYVFTAQGILRWTMVMTGSPAFFSVNHLLHGNRDQLQFRPVGMGVAVTVCLKVCGGGQLIACEAADFTLPSLILKEVP